MRTLPLVLERHHERQWKGNSILKDHLYICFLYYRLPANLNRVGTKVCPLVFSPGLATLYMSFRTERSGERNLKNLAKSQDRTYYVYILTNSVRTLYVEVTKRSLSSNT